VQRIQGEYLEMPGLRLKLDQVRRLTGVDAATCRVALDSLVTAKFLCVKPDGAYARASEGETSRLRTAKADHPRHRSSADAA
jgi:hypothetical protein